MPGWSIAFVRGVDRLNYGVGRFAMYLLFVLMGILMWSTIAKAALTPSLWTLEMAQFAMVAYYILGGPYSMQMGSHVRMDLAYARWSDRQKALVDAFTVLALIFYLAIMIWGAWDSLVYSLGIKWTDPGLFGLSWPQVGRLERSPTAWRPYLWPIKAIMVFGFFLMLLQATAYLIRDIATLRGEKI
ncbi:MAG: C4-dicarboxylate ABC transporter [Rhodobacteraceae bacterium GWE1_64_9]|nr:MAG: C4-dicarboxylate ABC transporter [Rhodobacteraceae bacterium GWE1_64_9]OHC47593.1 MAG: C4-dicarboxylate ABC transporter [Rhodobacteraceae bacterium GWF1_65_7]HBD90107.1 C4-dicarboxylate ABC transporter [Gemmobacter sp.]HBU15697.1 C4-dicarboxylate ABC transporter [Gemmobacter sp.]